MPPKASRRRAAEAQRLLDLLNALGSTTFRQLLWQRASELDLTYAQSQVLFHVADHPGCHMGDVAKAFGIPVTIVRTVSFTGYAAQTGASPYDGMDGQGAQDILNALEAEAKRYAGEIAAQLQKDGVNAETVVSHGRPGDTITELAAKIPGALVVMSSHGRSGLGRTLLGSVTDHVIRSSIAPVLVVRGHK